MVLCTAVGMMHATLNANTVSKTQLKYMFGTCLHLHSDHMDTSNCLMKFYI